MKSSVLKELVDQGKKPLVRLTSNLWDDSWGEKGMLARVVGATLSHEVDDPMVKVEFDYNEHKAHNLGLQSHAYHLREMGGRMGTAFEAGLMKEDNIHEGIYFMLTGDGSEVPVELVNEETPLAEYMASGSNVPYVEWLEAKLEELVPEAMKTWKKGF